MRKKKLNLINLSRFYEGETHKAYTLNLDEF